ALDRLVKDGMPSATTSTARFLKDAQFLYIAVHCPEPFMDRLSDKTTVNSPAVCLENCVEIYFMPDADQPECYHLAINSRGASFERLCNSNLSNQWNSGAQITAGRNEQGWGLEIAIPLTSFGPEGLPADRRCKANIYRTRQTVTPAESSGWSPTMAGFLMPRRFGFLQVQ
ncbi:MAG: hypothetical protein ABR497_07225, partial [Kiritimatiellia bacterium]